MKIKKLFMTMLLLAVTLAAGAQTAAKRLVVWQKSGEKVYIDLAELPETTFEDGMLVIRGSKTSVQFLLTNVLRYTYEGVSATGIDHVSDGRTISIAKNGDSVILHNLPNGSTACIYSANGTLLEQRTATGGQPITLSISQRPPGVYIVKAGNEAIKLLKR